MVLPRNLWSLILPSPSLSLSLLFHPSFSRSPSPFILPSLPPLSLSVPPSPSPCSHTHTHIHTDPSKVVVASTSTLVAILAVLIAIVCVLMIVMGLYIPYRKYKTKYTETANFKFVDLSESTNWDRARMKVREFADRFSRTKQPSKVGLVNEKNESTKLTNFPYESVS